MFGNSPLSSTPISGTASRKLIKDLLVSVNTLVTLLKQQSLKVLFSINVTITSSLTKLVTTLKSITSSISVFSVKSRIVSKVLSITSTVSLAISKLFRLNKVIPVTVSVLKNVFISLTIFINTNVLLTLLTNAVSFSKYATGRLMYAATRITEIAISKSRLLYDSSESFRKVAVTKIRTIFISKDNNV